MGGGGGGLTSDFVGLTAGWGRWGGLTSGIGLTTDTAVDID